MNPDIIKYLDKAQELLNRGYYSRIEYPSAYDLAKHMYHKLEKGKKTLKERIPVIPIVY